MNKETEEHIVSELFGNNVKFIEETSEEIASLEKEILHRVLEDVEPFKTEFNLSEVDVKNIVNRVLFFAGVKVRMV